eukprot:118970-Chlamydomonas_euryale.AAC.1
MVDEHRGGRPCKKVHGAHGGAWRRMEVHGGASSMEEHGSAHRPLPPTAGLACNKEAVVLLAPGGVRLCLFARWISPLPLCPVDFASPYSPSEFRLYPFAQ